MQEYLSLILTSSNKILLVDANINTRYLKGIEGYTYTTSAVNVEKTGDYFKNALSSNHVLAFSISRKNFKDAGGELTVTLLDTSTTLTYNANADVVYCVHCGAPTNVTLTSGLSQKSLVLSIASPRILLATDEGCLGWSSARTGSISFNKAKAWYNVFYVC